MVKKINKKIDWCFKRRDGLRVIEPNENLSKSYLEQAKLSLLKAERDLNEKDFLWSTVAIYYSEYYALYSFLQRLGIKCENHSCSILVVEFILGKDKTNTINEHKDKRIDAQYYMKTDKEPNIKTMIQEAKRFVAMFDEIVSNLSDKEIREYREKILIE